MMNEERTPGTRLRSFVERRFDQVTLDRVLLPAIADLQHECARSRRAFTRARAYWGLWKTIALCLARDAARDARPVIGRVLVRMAIIFSILMTAGMILATTGTRSGPASAALPAVLLLPQVFVMALPVAYFFSVLMETAPLPRRLLPAVLAMSSVCTLLMLAATLLVIPRTNQVYRQSVFERINAGTAAGESPRRVSFGSSEWTLTDLVRESLGSPAERETSMARTILSTRLANSTAPIMLGLVALGISGYTWHIALMNGAWVLMFYVAALRAAGPGAAGPAPARIWLVNAAFALGGLIVVLLRRQSTDEEPPRHFYART